MAQISLFDLVYVYAVIAYLSVCNIVKAVDEVCYRSFSGTGCTDKCDFLSRCGKKIYVMQNDFFRNISEIHIIKYHISGKLFVIDGTICLMYMFPCPDAGVLRGFSEDAVFIFCVY